MFGALSRSVLGAGRPADVYAILAAAGHTLSWTDRTTARMPTPDDAAALTIPEGVPLLLHQRLTRNADGQPLALEETRVSAAQATLSHDIQAAGTT